MDLHTVLNQLGQLFCNTRETQGLLLILNLLILLIWGDFVFF